MRRSRRRPSPSRSRSPSPRARSSPSPAPSPERRTANPIRRTGIAKVVPLAPTTCYGAFSPLALSEDGDARNRAKALVVDQRQESRILAQAKDSWERLKRWVNETIRD